MYECVCVNFDLLVITLNHQFPNYNIPSCSKLVLSVHECKSTNNMFNCSKVNCIIYKQSIVIRTRIVF